jgi:hypothetical protein
MVDPGCSSGGFDDVQDLHERRVVMARLSMNALKTIPQKGALSRVQRWGLDLLKVQAGLLTMQAAALTVTGAGHKSDAGSVAKLVDNWLGWCYILGDLCRCGVVKF